jgi:hypothetical protein
MTEVSIENEKEKNIDNKASQDVETFKQTPIQNSDLIKNELHPDDNIIEDISNDQPKIEQPKKCRLYIYVGRSLFIFLDKYNNPLFIIGPQWPMIIFVDSIIISLMLFLYIKFWKYLCFATRLFGSINFWTAFLSYTYTSIINPGYPKNTIGRNFGIPKNDYYFCDYCRFYLRKTSYGSHCDLCDICIEKYDHHCIWTGHCIGKNNKITFYIFVPSIFILLFYFGFAFVEGMGKSI